MTRSASIISSMATRRILADLAPLYEAQTGCAVTLTSVGGVDAAKRIQAGEPFDLALLARDALEKLAREGHLVASSVTSFAESPAALALPESVQCPGICDEASIHMLLSAAGRVGVSTGPSGKAVRLLLQEWGFVEPRTTLVEAPPGMPVARLVAAGAADIGVQQMSELLGEPGIKVFGPVPEDVLATTIFAIAVCRSAVNQADAGALLRYLSSADSAPAKVNAGMRPM